MAGVPLIAVVLTLLSSNHVSLARPEDNDSKIAFVQDFIEKTRTIGKTNKVGSSGLLDGYEAVKDLVVTELAGDAIPPKLNTRLLGIKDFAQVICEFERNPSLATALLVYRVRVLDGTKEPLKVTVDLNLHDRVVRLPDGTSSSAIRWIVVLQEVKTSFKTTYKVVRVQLLAKFDKAPQGVFLYPKINSGPMIIYLTNPLQLMRKVRIYVR